MSWVRTMSITYAHHFTKNPEVVHQEVLFSCQTLFFEGVRRFVMSHLYSSTGVTRPAHKTVRYLIAGMQEYESATCDPMKLMSQEVVSLSSMTDYKTALEVQGPHVHRFLALPWLATEVFTVCEPNYSEINKNVKDKHWALWKSIAEEEAMDAEESQL